MADFIVADPTPKIVSIHFNKIQETLTQPPNLPDILVIFNGIDVT